MVARLAGKGQIESKMAPRWAQEGSRNYLARFTRNASALFGPILGPSWAILGPSWPFSGGPGGHLEADVGLGRLDLGVQGGQKLRCQKPLKNNGKSRFLADSWRQQAFRKLAKWLLGGLVVGLKLRRQPLGCQVSFELVSKRQVTTPSQPNMFHGACMLGAT